MAVFTDNGYPNMVNLAHRMRPDGSIETDIVEAIATKTPLFQDIPWKKANANDRHRITQLKTRPAPARRLVNQGLNPQKSDTQQYEEVMTLFEMHLKIDERAASRTGDVDAFRMTEVRSAMLGFRETFESSVWYDSALTTPEAMHGLTPRYNNSTGWYTSSYLRKSGTVAGVNAESIWLICWDEDYCHGIYPDGVAPGPQHRDLGPEMVPESSSVAREFWALRDQITWEGGLAVPNHRYLFRFQWDPDDTTTHPDSGKSIYLAMQDMLDAIYDRSSPNLRFYMSRTSVRKLRAQMASNDANWLSQVMIPGTNFMTESFGVVPMRVTDRLVGETPIN